jgi:hypothetical protein
MEFDKIYFDNSSNTNNDNSSNNNNDRIINLNNVEHLEIYKNNKFIKKKNKFNGDTDIEQLHDFIKNNVNSLSDVDIQNVICGQNIFDSKGKEINNIVSIINESDIVKNTNINNLNNSKDLNDSKDTNNNDLIILYKELVKDFNDFNESTIKGIIKLKLNIKKIEKIILKNKILSNKKNTKNNDWGFTEQRVIPKSIEIFFNIEPNSKLSRTYIGKLFQEYIEKNDLKGNINIKNKLDKRIYKLDDKLTKLFGLTEEDKNKINSCQSSNIKFPNGFNFYNYQKWIKKLYTEEFENNKVIN